MGREARGIGPVGRKVQEVVVHAKEIAVAAVLYDEVLVVQRLASESRRGAGAPILGIAKEIAILDWVDGNAAPLGEEILTCIKGFKWEVKDAKGGIGDISIKAVEFLDESKSAIDPVKLTGIEIKERVGLYKVSMIPSFSVRANGMQLEINGAKAGNVFAVYNMQGKAIAGGMLMSSNLAVNVPNAGSYIVRVGSEMNRINVK